MRGERGWLTVTLHDAEDLFRPIHRITYCGAAANGTLYHRIGEIGADGYSPFGLAQTPLPVRVWPI
jgi:hypothetical protein